MLIVVGFSSCNNDECVDTEKVETEMNESLLNLETSLSQSRLRTALYKFKYYCEY